MKFSNLLPVQLSSETTSPSIRTIASIAWVGPLMLGSTIAIQPVQAATFTLADSGARIDAFSTTPFDLDTRTATYTTAAEQSGAAIATADAEATFTVDEAVNRTASRVKGDGPGSGVAHSFARVIGSFLVNTSDTLQFNFRSFLALAAAKDTAKERAMASGKVLFQLFDTSSNKLLDSFGLVGQANPWDRRNSIRFFGQSPNLRYTTVSDFSRTVPASSSYNASSFSFLEVLGQYSRVFDRATEVTLVEVKTTTACAASY